MNRLLAIAFISILVVIPISPPQHTYAGEGEIVATFPVDGDMAIVMYIQSALELVYIHDGEATSQAVTLPWEHRPVEIVAQISGSYIHVVAGWETDVKNHPAPVHHYRWELPGIRNTSAVSKN